MARLALVCLVSAVPLASVACAHAPPTGSRSALVKRAIQRGELRSAALALATPPIPAASGLIVEVAGETLNRLLSHAEPHVRLQAARSLAQSAQGAPDHVLRRALRDPLPEIRSAALACLRRGARMAQQQALVAELALHDASPSVRVEAVRSLAVYAVELPVVRLLGWLTLDADPRVATAAAIALHSQGRPEALVALTWKLHALLEAGRGLHPGAAAVVRYAGSASDVGLVPTESVIKALAESLRPEDRASVAGIVVSQSRSSEFVTRLCADPDPWVRAVLVADLVAEKQPGWQAAARRGLADPRPVVQLAVVAALDRSGSLAALSLLRGTEPRGRSRVAECCALVRHGNADGAWRLLRSPRTATRDRVRLLVAMVRGGVPTAASDLLAMLDEPSPRVREQVALSLARLRPALAWPSLARALADSDLGVRVAAAGAVLALSGEDRWSQDLSQ